MTPSSENMGAALISVVIDSPSGRRTTISLPPDGLTGAKHSRNREVVGRYLAPVSMTVSQVRDYAVQRGLRPARRR